MVYFLAFSEIGSVSVEYIQSAENYRVFSPFLEPCRQDC